uniref:NBS-LRR disease resistance protein NBS46 n=1 Tax=Dimocarpus longan TaxID=128017 RepID=A0A0F6TMR7_9ROSI|nr:NBS-LRR disease resistance protein NBS46 [Dimocarpus longan]
MAEHVLSAVLSVLLKKLTPGELLEFATQGCVRSKLKKWEKTLKMINALLIDAEEKQLTNGAVKMWLEDLQDLAYDAEDILDEYATEALRRKLKIEEHQASTSRARKLIPACCIGCTPHALWSDFSMPSKIDGITSRLQDLCNQKNELGLIEIAGGKSTASCQRPTTTCLPTEPAVYGRDEDKAKILEQVLKHEPGQANFGVIPIVGMGGIGKTTLARQVYNDEKVKLFDLKAWVCVSDDFDVLRISKAILELISPSSCDKKELNAVQNQLNDALKEKRFLIVLDDVWSENYDLWESLKAPFMAGAAGSKIIVTTRSTEVAATMRPREHEQHNLKGLSNGDCWSIFEAHAFNNRGINDLWNFNMIREKVVQKCKGLPLAARTLGGLLYYKETEAEWMDVLNSQIWDLKDSILPVLRLSYFHLPSYLKRCFAYCAILPKDYEFEENELIFLWMAEGLIQKSRDDEQLEGLGGKYFHDLLSRSIFQKSSSNTSKFIMHDLVNDLAVKVSGKLSFRLENELQSQIFENSTRYTSYLCDYYNRISKFAILNEAKKLRTHLTVPPINDRYVDCYISNTAVSNLLSRFKRLRVLSLQRYHIVEVPDSIGNLRLLRYLNLSDSDIRSLPESINSMCNLQTLILRNCRKFLKWPISMENLINLRHLDILGASLVEEMPMGIRKWVYLQTLSNFIVGKDSGSKLEDLKDLKSLCGELHISRLENVTDFQHKRKIVLRNQKDLKVLLLEWGSRFNASTDEEMDKRLLDMLRPHQNLEKLTIKCYGGKIFSSWVGDSSFSKIIVLKLENCERCTSLPSLGLLGSLKSLTIKGINELESINSTFYGHCQNPFISLETLCFENLEKCESWDPIKENESFPRLQKLSIVNCPKLSERLPNKLSSLKKLVICKCEQLVVSLANMPKLCKLKLDKCKKIVCTSSACLESLECMTLSNISDFGDLSGQELKKVQNLRIEGCKEFIKLWENEIFLEKPRQGLHILSALKKLDLINCNTLTTLPEGIKQKNVYVEELRIESCDSLNFIFRGQLSWSKLTSLHVSHCPKLTTLSMTGHLPLSLKHLTIVGCSELITLFPKGQFPETLETLNICSCEKLESIVEEFHNNQAVDDIHISDCENLKSLSESLETLTNLKSLYISNCGGLASFPKGGFPDSNLRVDLCGCEMLEALPSGIHTLSSLRIFGCPNMSLSEEDLPTKLTQLGISSLKQYKQLTERGFHNFTSLTGIHISGRQDGEPFQEMGMEITLPPNLIWLRICKFSELKCLPFKDFEDLSSLQILDIDSCPKLTSLPSNLPSSLQHLYIQGCLELTSLPSNLPSSLEGLFITDCPSLKEACKRDKGKEWPKLADIPCVLIVPEAL